MDSCEPTHATPPRGFTTLHTSGYGQGILEEARELLRRQRSDDRSLSDRHYAARLRYEGAAEELQAFRGLFTAFTSLLGEVNADFESLRARDPIAITQQLQTLQVKVAEQRGTVVSLVDKLSAEEGLTAGVAKQLDALRAELESVGKESAQLGQLADSACAMEEQLQALRSQQLSRSQEVSRRNAELIVEASEVETLGREAMRLRGEIEEMRSSVTASEAAAEVARSRAETRECRAVDVLLNAAGRMAAACTRLATLQGMLTEIRQRESAAELSAEQHAAHASGVQERLVATEQRRKAALARIEILRGQERVLEGLAAMQRYRAEIRSAERLLQRRPAPGDIPARCAQLEQQCENLCGELNAATEDLQLLQCGMAETRYTEMALAVDTYKRETIPNALRRCDDARARVHDLKMSLQQWEDERERHDLYARVLQEDLDRLTSKLQEEEGREREREIARRRIVAEDAAMERERARWRAEDAFFVEQEAANIEGRNSVTTTCDDSGDLAVASSAPSRSVRRSTTAAQRPLIPSASLPTHAPVLSPFFSHDVSATDDTGETPADKASGSFGFVVTQAVYGIAHWWSRGADVPRKSDTRPTVL